HPISRGGKGRTNTQSTHRARAARRHEEQQGQHPTGAPRDMKDCAEIIAEVFLDTNVRFPPFDVCLTYHAICEKFPLDKEVASALLSILNVLNNQIPDSYRVSLPDLHRQKEEFREGKGWPAPGLNDTQLS